MRVILAEFQRMSEETETGINLPALIFPTAHIIHIVDIVQADDITRSYLDAGKVQLRTADEREIPFLEGILRIVHQMLLLVEQDAELRTNENAQQRYGPDTQQHGNAEIAQFAFIVAGTAGKEAAEILPGAVIGLVEQQFRLYADVRGEVYLRKSPDIVPELELRAERLAVYFKQVCAGLDAQVNTLRLGMEHG